MTGIEKIAQERLKQTAYYPDDSHYKNGELLLFARFMLSDGVDWDANESRILLIANGFDPAYLDKMDEKSVEERLIIAGALCAAEIDRDEKETNKNS